ncbi:MAG: hypothetical protein JY451_13590 [Erythrobacter sp.]|nr:MAG: hypothetical protein JY451_13590 [Erythrobacter sp.]
MSKQSLSGTTADSVEGVLREELAHGDGILATARPILRHLLVNDGQGLFSDQVLASVRGMMNHLAIQLLHAQAAHEDTQDHGAFVGARVDMLAAALLDRAALLGHAHALTIEANLSDRLSRRSGIDVVLSPLLQELMADRDPEISGLAMQTLAAQARFMQQARRMELPLSELPQEYFDLILTVFREVSAETLADTSAAEATLRAQYDPAACRVARMSRLIGALERRAKRALEMDHAGVAIFITALHVASGQPRDIAVLSLGENQVARFALSLRAAGLEQTAVEDQFHFLHPDITLPEGFDTLRADQAAIMLVDAQPWALQ